MYRDNKFKNRVLALTATATAVTALYAGGPVIAAEQPAYDPSVVTLEQVIVTARKREENLLSVPIAVSVLTGADLEKNGIQNLTDAVQTLPAVSVTKTPVGDLLFIRGIGSGENQGFEMSVGTFVDGVYYGRGRSSRYAFLDVERIEVLKGPQPILFGKNTIAGAFNITTRKPTDQFEVDLDGYIEPEFGTYQATGAISGPISSTLKGRFVARYSTTDGYVHNEFLDKDAPSRDDWVGRGILVWEPSDLVEFTLKGEYGEGDVEGGWSQISKASPTLRALIAPVDPNAEYSLNYTKSGPGTVAPFNREYEKNKVYNVTLSSVWDLGAHEFNTITSYVGYDVDYAFDSDFTPLNFIQQVWDQKWYSVAQEFRIASTSKGMFEYQGGVYLSSEKLDSFKVASFDFGQTPLPFGTANRVQDFHQKTDNWSAFVEGTLNATDDLALVAGYRHTYDRKKMDKTFYWADLGSIVPNPNPTVLQAIGLGNPHEYKGIKRSTKNDSLAFTIRYQPDEVMYYASYTQGFKAGGFDEGDSQGILANIIFDDEKVDSYELGLKADALGGRLRIQAAAFYSKYDNLQVSIFDGVASLVVGNAASAISKGLELQGQFAATNRLTLGMTATYLDSEYDSYKAGPCPYGAGTVCDLSGKNLPYSPEFSGAFTAHWEDQFTNGWTYALDGKVFHSSSFFTAGDLDPFVAQGAFTKIDASVTLISPNESWSLSVIGKNLTDKTTAHFGDDIPLSNILGNNYEQFIDPPRTIALQIRYKFR